MSMEYVKFDKHGKPTGTTRIKQPGAEEYGPGRTKQSAKDSCDIKKILARAQKAGSLSHLQKHGAYYGDFSDVGDLLTAQNRLNRANAMFAELPSEVRREFGQSPSKFFEFVNDPANKDRLAQLLPQIAEPGRFFPAVNNVAAKAGTAGAATGAPEGSEATATTSPPALEGTAASEAASAPDSGAASRTTT